MRGEVSLFLWKALSANSDHWGEVASQPVSPPPSYGGLVGTLKRGLFACRCHPTGGTAEAESALVAHSMEAAHGLLYL
jgi:hypothetical protein